MKFLFNCYSDQQTFIQHIIASDRDYSSSQQGPLGFYKFKLSECGLPSVEELKASLLGLQRDLAPIPWRKNGLNSKSYLGYGICSNPDFVDPFRSPYSQCLGSYEIDNSYSLHINGVNFRQLKNSYHDTYAFRDLNPDIQRHFTNLFIRIGLCISRSRISYLYPSEEFLKGASPFHIDEYPFQLLRVNIPIFTSNEYVLEIKGDDGLGNSLDMEVPFEEGYIYIWNTRIPHRVYCTSLKPVVSPRVHLVLGLIPWLQYTLNKEGLERNRHFGKSIEKMIVQGDVFSNVY